MNEWTERTKQTCATFERKFVVDVAESELTQFGVVCRSFEFGVGLVGLAFYVYVCDCD